MSCGSSCGGSCAVCKAVSAVVALLLTLTTIAAVIGVWNTHHTATGAWVFGTTAGSVALVTFILSLMAWKKVVGKMCPCRSKACGTGCGCGTGGGVCPGCGKMPCKCK